MAQQRDRTMEDWFDRQREERRAELARIAEHSVVQRGGQTSNPVRQMVDQRFKTTDADADLPPPPEPERPEAIVVEVRGLFETRPVTNLLQSPRFRSQLERIVRASVMVARETHANSDASSRSSDPPQPSRHEPELEDQLRSYQEQQRRRLQQQQQQQQPQQPQQQQQQQQQQQRQQLHQQQHQQQQQQQQQQHQQQQRFVPELQADEPPVANIPPYLERQPISFADSLLHEQIITDISELLHQGLVSTTLNSNFRDRLENLVGNRVDAAGGGTQSLQALQQLPPSGHMRNDFSHLGLQVPEINIDAEMDTLSIVSATAAAVPLTHTSLGLSRELAANREEMRQMRQMLRMVFDMQADLKRSVQQEVAAAMTSASPATRPPPPPSSAPFTSGQCLICLSAEADTIAYRCGHLCMCYGCSVRLSQHQSSRQTCPVCRAPVQDFVRIYKCSDSSA